VKLYWPSGYLLGWIETPLKADIRTVDDYAVRHGRPGMEYTGAVNNQALIANLANGAIDVLLTYTWRMNDGSPEVWPANVQAAVSDALVNRKLKKLMV
jgi:hypothetical protein